MVAILISTRPQWCEKTINGLKITEIRKGTALFKAINKLIKEQGVAPMLIYCTKGKPYFYFGRAVYKAINGKIVAECDFKVEEIKNSWKDEYVEIGRWRDTDKTTLIKRSKDLHREIINTNPNAKIEYDEISDNAFGGRTLFIATIIVGMK